MKIKSVSALSLYVKNLGKSTRFYESLGFVAKKKEKDHVVVYSNWFGIDLIPIEKEQRPEYRAAAEASHDGALIYLSVDDVDAAYEELKGMRIKPASKPADSLSGNREFLVRDPDGYALVFFKKK